MEEEGPRCCLRRPLPAPPSTVRVPPPPCSFDSAPASPRWRGREADAGIDVAMSVVGSTRHAMPSQHREACWYLGMKERGKEERGKLHVRSTLENGHTRVRLSDLSLYLSLSLSPIANVLECATAAEITGVHVAEGSAPFLLKVPLWIRVGMEAVDKRG